MSEAAGSVAAEWRSGWPVVVASTFGMTLVGTGYYAVGTFIAPLERAFGWNRAEISAGFVVFALTGALLKAPVGMMLDRWGSRRLAVPGTILVGLIFALFSTLNGSLIWWLTLWLLLAVVCELVGGSIWSAAVSKTFARSRGLAISLTMLGAAGAGISVPLWSNYLIEHYSWRTAYLVMGLGWCSLVAVIGYFMLHEKRNWVPAVTTVASAPVEPTGYALRDGIRSANFVKIVTAIFISNLLNIALAFHLLPILNWNGLERETAVWVMSSLGVSMIVGTAAYGLIGDVVPARIITAVLVAMPAITCLMLLQPAASTLRPLIAVSVFGVSAGAQMPANTYLTTRYFGMRSFGALTGFMSIASAAATAIAPFIAGVIFDRTASYSFLLVAGIPLVLLAALVLLSLDKNTQFGARPA